jgi:hypothetical protein
MSVPSLIMASAAIPVTDVNSFAVKDNWNSNKGEYANDLTTITDRTSRVRQWLWKRNEEEIAVVGHAVGHLLVHHRLFDSTVGLQSPA